MLREQPADYVKSRRPPAAASPCGWSKRATCRRHLVGGTQCRGAARIPRTSRPRLRRDSPRAARFVSRRRSESADACVYPRRLILIIGRLPEVTWRWKGISPGSPLEELDANIWSLRGKTETALARNRRFESSSLQRRVQCEPNFRGRIPSMTVGTDSFVSGTGGSNPFSSSSESGELPAPSAEPPRWNQAVPPTDANSDLAADRSKRDEGGTDLPMGRCRHPLR
jgi:hypothetical protein